MAGIGVKLHRFYDKGTLTTNLIGMGYSSLLTIAPIFLVIVTIIIMQSLLGFMNIAYAQKNLFSSTILYMFIFSLLCTSLYNSVLSKYLSDIITRKTYDDILPCYYMGLLLNIVSGCVLAVPFCIWQGIHGHIELYYIFTEYLGFLSLIFVFYSMTFLSIFKDYKKISIYYLIGMIMALMSAYIIHSFCNFQIAYTLLLSLSLGFLFIAILEYAKIRAYFKNNSGNYKEVFIYLGKYKKLILANFLYTLGLYISNFVFWNTDLHMIVAGSFISAPAFDMASCLAIFTNISASVIFFSQIEMNFQNKYKAYSEAILGGRGTDIDTTKRSMFRLLAELLMSIARIQFIVTLVIFMIFMIFLPQLGFGGLILRIYPCLTVGYFILFLMYSEIILLYFFEDLNGSLITALLFSISNLIGSSVVVRLPSIWYGFGLVTASLIGFAFAYFRLRWLEQNINEMIFCKGNLIDRKYKKCPSNKVFDRYE